ncbi:MAG: ATP-dependent endonuclease [Candidatus Yonathbacteria bacterium]|nr:ATP-dependent endonuclease [Candidatus Yonathbacteria bacterium]NTW47393.1 ATP-dependent endonuclease [Candidatus Yonathbacteria bacterium]
MKIFKIKIENYRLLKKFSIDLEDKLSLIIGKNNTGKTSILTILDKSLNFEKIRFSLDDFNVDFKKDLKTLIETNEDTLEDDFNKYNGLGIKLKLFIKYGEGDNLTNISRVMMDLDPTNNVIVLGFDYVLDYSHYIELKRDYSAFKINEESKKAAESKYEIKCFFDFLRETHSSYFKIRRKTIEFDQHTKEENEANFIDLIKEKINIKDIINFKYISAKREVANTDSDKTLSAQTSKIYEKTEISDDQSEVIEVFKDRLTEADASLSNVYKTLFANAIEKVRKFGGVKINESEIEIISTLQHQKLLEGNTTVVYRHDVDSQLPEHYNGLGYMNLISMIFEIEILLQDFKKEKESKPADINLLFIEEPEAHTHPQMQYVFIKNIKELLREGIKRTDGENRELQYIISTHSSHIVADSDFDDIKYLKKDDSDGVTARNLKDLQKEYTTGKNQYQFLRQYLTISRAEIFFAEKAVLIEGDTERILIPTIMKKVDIEEVTAHETAGTTDPCLPLLSQNISIIEVGAYSQIFEKFIDFLGIKSLVVTDLDTVDADGVACKVADGVGYSNSALNFFFGTPTLAALRGFAIGDKQLSKVTGAWARQADGKVCVVYQVEENGYNARSFEDGFIHLNRAFVTTNKDSFQGLQNRADFDDGAKDAYDLAGNCIKKKTHFALDILFHSNENLDNWLIPSYIREGLLWLKKD